MEESKKRTVVVNQQVGGNATIRNTTSGNSEIYAGGNIIEGDLTIDNEDPDTDSHMSNSNDPSESSKSEKIAGKLVEHGAHILEGLLIGHLTK